MVLRPHETKESPDRTELEVVKISGTFVWGINFNSNGVRCETDPKKIRRL